MKTPLRTRSVTAVAATTILTVALIILGSASLLWNLRSADLAHARAETVGLSRILSEQTTASLQDADLVLQNIQASLPLLQGDGLGRHEETMHRRLRNRLAGIKQIRSLFIVDAEGRSIVSSLRFPASGRLVSERAYFSTHRENPAHGLYVGTPERANFDGAWTIFMSRRLSDAGGRFVGVVVVSLDVGYFETLYHAINFDGIGPIKLIHLNGTLVASEPRNEAAIGVQPAGPAFPNLRSAADTLTRVEPAAQDDERIATYRGVDGFPFVIGVFVSMETALAGWQGTASRVILGDLGAIAFVMLAGIGLVRKLRKEEAMSRAVKESDERLQGTINSAMDAIVAIDGDQRVVLFNPAAERMFGWKASEIIGAPLDRLLPERYRTAHGGHVQSFDAAGKTSRMMAPFRELVGVRASGQEFPIESAISQVKLGSGILHTAILRDVTERRQMENQLIESNRQLRQLSASLQQVREEERTRIARELHDELGQRLTALRLDINWLESHLGDDGDILAKKLDDIKARITTTIKSVRQLSTDLRPSLLDDLGLVPAIEWLAAEFSASTGIPVRLELESDDIPGADTATCLFRIVQECLTNISRHAQASAAEISLRSTGTDLELCIRDDGRGLPQAEESRAQGFGLIGIRERAMRLGGAAEFLSPPGGGTEIAISIPITLPATTESLA